MNKLLKKLSDLLAVGFISAEQKTALESEYNALEASDKEVVKALYEKSIGLPVKNEEPGDNEVTAKLKSLVAEAAKDLTEKAKEELMDNFNKALEEHKSMLEKKAGVYAPGAQEARKSIQLKTRALCEAIINQDDSKLKEMTTDATGSPYAGYTVDSELSAEIHHLVTQYGIARREMMTLALTKGSYKANDLATDVIVYWVDEGAVISSTQAVLGQEDLTLKKLGCIVSLTRELLEDSEIDLSAFLYERVAENMAKAEDLAFFVGDGTATYGSFTGLLNNTSVNTVVMTGTTFASLTADDLLDMQDATPAAVLANAKYVLHRSIMNIVRKLKDVTSGQYIYQAPSGNMPGQIWDKPYILSEAMPTKAQSAANKPFVLFGDLKKSSIFGYKGGIVADRFNAGTIKNVAGNADINLITTDREAIRFVERVGKLDIIPTAMTRLKTAAPSA